MVNEVLITVTPLNKLLDLLEIKVLLCRKLSFSFFNSVFLPATGRQFSVRKSFNFLTVQEFRVLQLLAKSVAAIPLSLLHPPTDLCADIHIPLP